jgi:hypothetical protein
MSEQWQRVAALLGEHCVTGHQQDRDFAGNSAKHYCSARYCYVRLCASCAAHIEHESAYRSRLYCQAHAQAYTEPNK